MQQAVDVADVAAADGEDGLEVCLVRPPVSFPRIRLELCSTMHQKDPS